jgi:hypothetical protein
MPADAPTILATSGGIDSGRRTRFVFTALTDFAVIPVKVSVASTSDPSPIALKCRRHYSLHGDNPPSSATV